jgi:hypothetical protein
MNQHWHELSPTIKQAVMLIIKANLTETESDGFSGR